MTLSELASLTLVPATLAQALESRKRTWPQWGGELTEEQYLGRYSRMDTRTHAVDSRMITWVLVPRDNPSTLDFMCACETYKRRGLIRHSGSTSVEEATCYAVASVYTPPHKRGRGYASHMMNLLHWVTSGKTSEYNLPQFPAEWGAPPPEVAEAGNGMFSILYSDLGENFYKQAGPGIEKAGGWEARRATSTIWEIPPNVEAQQGVTGGEWTWLKPDDLDTFWKKDSQVIRRTMETLPDSSPDYDTERPKVSVTYLSDEGVGSFGTFRSIFTAGLSVDAWGVVKNIAHADADEPVYATWSVDVRPWPPTLIVTRISASESEFPDLLCQIQGAARSNGISRMEIWNIPKHLLKIAAETNGDTFERKEHLPSIKWYGAGRTEDVEWIFNEKFCWC